MNEAGLGEGLVISLGHGKAWVEDISLQVKTYFEFKGI